MKFTLAVLSVFAISCITISSCDKEEGPAGPAGPAGLKSLVAVDTLAPGDACGNGGFTIKSGIDKNDNNKLDANEVENTQNVCNGSNGDYDKQVIIPFYNQISSFLGGSAQFPGQFMCFAEFNIENYQGIDSVVLYANFSTGSTAIGKVLLYNFTDNKVIENSETTLTTSVAGFRKSRNFSSSFPRKKFDLGFQVTSDGGSAATNYVYLVLYRK